MTAKKHHYIPKCYLKAWTGADRLLCEYRNCHGRIVVKRRHPAETGWEDGLYSIRDLPPEYADVVEEKLFLKVDQDASNALAALRQGDDLDAQLVEGWARFLMSLLQRHPGRIDFLRQRVLEQFEEINAKSRASMDDVEGYDAFVRLNSANLLGQMFAYTVEAACNLEEIGRILVNMHTMVVVYNDARHRLLTSDNPLFLSEGLHEDKAFIMLPLSPRVLFIAANTRAVLDEIRRDVAPEQQIEVINRHVVRRAHKYVYGLCENQLDFVVEHFGKERQEERDEWTASVAFVESGQPLPQRRAAGGATERFPAR